MNEATCNTCGNEIEEESEVAFFDHDRFEFRLSKDPSICKDCAKNHFTDLFDRLGPDLVSKGRKGQLEVNWGDLSKNPDTFHDKIEILVALGILSPHEEGNWELILYQSGLSLSPYGGPWSYYFTERSYLEDYVRTQLSETSDFLKARRIDKVALRDELLGET